MITERGGLEDPVCLKCRIIVVEWTAKINGVYSVSLAILGFSYLSQAELARQEPFSALNLFSDNTERNIKD